MVCYILNVTVLPYFRPISPSKNTLHWCYILSAVTQQTIKEPMSQFTRTHTPENIFLPKKPMFPKLCGATGAYPSVPTKTLAAKKNLFNQQDSINHPTVIWIQSITRIQKKLYSCDLDFSGSCVASHSGGFKKHGILFLISLGFEP